MLALARHVLDALPMTIYAMDLEGRITSANRGAWPRFAERHDAAGESPGSGTPENAAPGAFVWDAMDDQAARPRIEQAMALLRTGRAPAVHWEQPCAAARGSGVCHAQVTPLLDGEEGTDRALVGFVLALVDVTPSHRACEALVDAGVALVRATSQRQLCEELTQQARLAAQAERVAIALADGKEATPRLVHHAGYPDDATALEQRLAPAWLEALAQGRVLVSRDATGVELTAPMTGAGVRGAITVRRDDQRSPDALDDTLDDAPGALTTLATLATQAGAAMERIRLEQREAGARRLQAMGEVATGAGHELRHPLSGLASAAQLLRFRAQDDPVLEKNVGRILREVERLNRMAGSLLDYGRSTPPLSPGDPDAVWDDVIEASRGQLESRGLVLCRDRAKRPARCLLNAERLAQMFGAVLENAVDAAPEASDLMLESSVLSSGEWRCRLRNGGPAIPTETLPRVFELFFSTKPGGSGLGLPLCERIAGDHGGTIGDASGEEGTVVAVTLPLAGRG